jgi:hypothetical protein
MEEATRSTVAAVLRLGPLARLARVHVLRHIYILAHPEGLALHQQPHLCPAKVSAKLPVVALAKHLRAQPAARWDAKPVHCALAPPVQQAASHHKRSARLGPLGIEDGGAMHVDRLADLRSSPPQDGPEEGVDGQLQHQGLDEHLNEEVIV